MSLLAPAALAWLALLPILVLLWLMKLRRREARVSAAFLWEQASREARVDSFSRRLLAILLLLLQLLAALLLVLALARPGLRVASSSAPEVAVLVDTSASMGALRDGSTRFEEARRQARRLLEGAPPGAQVLLASYDRTARVLAPFSRDRASALRALDGLSCRQASGDGQAGLALAASILASRPRAEAFLVGDALPRGTLPPRLSFLSCGQPAPNLGFFALRAARNRDGSYLVVAGVRNYGGRPEQRDLELRRGGVLVASRRVGLPARGREVARFRLPASGDPVVEARLPGADALPADDRAWTVLPRQASLSARVVGPGNLFAEKALAAVPGVTLERGSGPGTAPLVLWEAEPPWPLPTPGLHLLLRVPAALRRGAPLESGFLLAPEPNPLLRDVPLADLAVSGLQPLELPPGAEVLARAGGREALVLVRQGARTALVLAFDLYHSDLPLSPALPLLFASLVEQRSLGQGPVATEAVPGEPLEIRTDQPVQAQLPSGQVLDLSPEDGRAVLADSGQVGLYRVRLQGQDWPVAVNLLDEGECDLEAPSAPSAFPPPGAAPGGPVQAGLLEVWPWLGSCALALLLLEWLLYHRRPR